MSDPKPVHVTVDFPWGRMEFDGVPVSVMTRNDESIVTVEYTVDQAPTVKTKLEIERDGE